MGLIATTGVGSAVDRLDPQPILGLRISANVEYETDTLTHEQKG